MNKSLPPHLMGTYLAKAYDALDTLSGVAAITTQADILKAIHTAWMPTEPLAVGTIVGVFYARNESMVPNEVWVRAVSRRRKTKTNPGPFVDHWFKFGDSHTSYTWEELLSRGDIREMEVKA
jgi:hypothetical protein